MKSTISIIAGIAAAIGVFYLDALLINHIISVLPPSAHDWLGLIKIALWVLAVLWTFGIALAIGVVVGHLIAAIVGAKSTKKAPEMSRWQQRIEQMKKEQLERLNNK